MSIEITDDLLKSLKAEYETRKSDPRKFGRPSRGALNSKEVASSLNGRVRLQATKTCLPRQEDSQLDISLTSICDSDAGDASDGRRSYINQASGDANISIITVTPHTNEPEEIKMVENKSSLVLKSFGVNLEEVLRKHRPVDPDGVRSSRFSIGREGSFVKTNRNSNVPQV
eukprot:TRINITY_DN3779_c0_g2_i12.p3 TRINITY_DN3779_c0_g2~~TRINITY_DN3779_c0_g2_i12.p3  ORF type:complete len:171 (-),score=54.98 TRINITY_DN3779_c0_g2_i12:158-670(-)